MKKKTLATDARIWLLLAGLGLVMIFFAQVPAAAADTFDCGTLSMDQGDCQALVALFQSTDGEKWQESNNWLSGDPCNETADSADDWLGVTCSAGRITAISLASNKLTGPLPPEIGNLSALQTLELTDNKLSDALPDELLGLTTLSILRLGGNKLEGEIPAAIKGMTGLEFLYLNRNKFSGTIPAEIGELPNLLGLYLHGNQLHGAVPADLCNPPNLFNVNVGYNLLETSETPIGTCPDGYDADWRTTQTLPPQPRIKSLSPIGRDAVSATVTLEWDKIPFADSPGFIRVFVADASGAYGDSAVASAEKNATEITISGLPGDKEQFFVLQTISTTNAFNDNVLISEFSDEVATTPVALTLTELQARAAGAGPASLTLLAAGLLLLTAAAGAFLRRRAV